MCSQINQIKRLNAASLLGLVRDTTAWLDETDCISHSSNTLGKGKNPIILPPAMGK